MGWQPSRGDGAGGYPCGAVHEGVEGTGGGRCPSTGGVPAVSPALPRPGEPSDLAQVYPAGLDLA